MYCKQCSAKSQLLQLKNKCKLCKNFGLERTSDSREWTNCSCSEV